MFTRVVVSDLHPSSCDFLISVATDRTHSRARDLARPALHTLTHALPTHPLVPSTFFPSPHPHDLPSSNSTHALPPSHSFRDPATRSAPLGRLLWRYGASPSVQRPRPDAPARRLDGCQWNTRTALDAPRDILVPLTGLLPPIRIFDLSATLLPKTIDAESRTCGQPAACREGPSRDARRSAGRRSGPAVHRSSPTAAANVFLKPRSAVRRWRRFWLIVCTPASLDPKKWICQLHPRTVYAPL